MFRVLATLAVTAGSALLAACAAAPVPAVAGGASAGPPPVPLLSAPDRRLTIGDTMLRYREIGRGEPVLLLHGFSARLERWTGLADSLARTHQMIAMDFRGFGGSSRFTDPAHYGLAHVRDVLRLLDHLRIERAHLVGHSMGAVVAANVAQRFPERVATLTLAAGPFFRDTAAAVQYFTPHLAALERGEGLRSFLAANFPALRDSALDAVSREAMARNDQRALLAAGRSFYQMTLRPDVRPAAMPTLVIVGTADPVAELSRWLAGWWPGARLVEVLGADHGAGLLFHPRFLDEVRRQLASRGGGASPR